ncbi:hypothetical protein C1645_774298, partial [Glomus cerebriforme]
MIILQKSNSFKQSRKGQIYHKQYKRGTSITSMLIPCQIRQILYEIFFFQIISKMTCQPNIVWIFIMYYVFQILGRSFLKTKNGNKKGKSSHFFLLEPDFENVSLTYNKHYPSILNFMEVRFVFTICINLIL